MTDEHHEHCFVRSRANEVAEMIDDFLPEDLNTDQLGHFWQHMTEACVLRLTRLKPEMVTRNPLYRDD